MGGDGPDAVLESGRLAFRRYLLTTSGISSTALGIALIVSFLAASYGQAEAERIALADGSSVQVVVRGDPFESLLLDENPSAVATPEAAPTEETIEAASPAGPIDLGPNGEPIPQGPQVQPSAVPSSTQPAITPPGPAAAPTPVPTQKPQRQRATNISVGPIDDVNLTFYDCLDQGFCGRMSSGVKVYEGAAACSWNLPQGTRLRIHGDPTGRVYVCEDRGLLDDTWIDVFFHDPEDGWAWQKAVGRVGTIEIVSLP